MRDLQFVVSDGRTFAERETRRDHAPRRARRRRSLTYRQIDTATSGRYRIVKTYVDRSGAQRAAGRRRFQSLTGRRDRSTRCSTRRCRTTATTTPGRPRTARCSTATPSAGERADRRARLHARPPTATWAPATAGATCSDDFTDGLAVRGAPNGNVVQTGLTRLDGVRGTAPDPGARLRRDERGGAVAPPSASLAPGLRRRAGRLRGGWHRYLGLAEAPARRRTALRCRVRRVGDGPGRARGQDLPRRLHRVADDAVGVGDRARAAGLGRVPPVWSRDLYQIATALLAAGDRAARRSRADLSVRPSSRGPTARSRRTRPSTARRTGRHLQLDEVAFPIVLAWQLGRTDAATWRT